MISGRILFITYHLEKSIGWVRVAGYGIKYKSLAKHGLMFSERYGYTKYIVLFGWVIGLLKK